MKGETVSPLGLCKHSNVQGTTDLIRPASINNQIKEVLNCNPTFILKNATLFILSMTVFFHATFKQSMTRQQQKVVVVC